MTYHQAAKEVLDRIYPGSELNQRILDTVASLYPDIVHSEMDPQDVDGWAPAFEMTVRLMTANPEAGRVVAAKLDAERHKQASTN